MHRHFLLVWLSGSVCLSCRPDSNSGTSAANSVGSKSVGVPTVAPVLSLGATATFPTYSVSALSVHDCGNGQTGLPRTSHQLVGVEIEVRNLGTAPFPANPFRAKLVDGDGVEHSSTLVGCPAPFPARMLRPGEGSRGFVPFELPRTLSRAVLEYRPALHANTNAQPVGRFRLEWGI